MISMISAICKDNAIGKNNDLIYHIPEDLKRFKKLTTGKSIIMGRKTFESLPSILPHRKHIIITRNKSFSVNHDDVTIYHNIKDVLELALSSNEEFFVIGGESIYKSFLPYATKIYLTKILKTPIHSDCFFPQIDTNMFTTTYSSKIKHCSKNDINFLFETLISRSKK